MHWKIPNCHVVISVKLQIAWNYLVLIPLVIFFPLLGDRVLCSFRRRPHCLASQKSVRSNNFNWAKANRSAVVPVLHWSDRSHQLHNYRHLCPTPARSQHPHRAPVSKYPWIYLEMNQFIPEIERKLSLAPTSRGSTGVRPETRLSPTHVFLHVFYSIN